MKSNYHAHTKWCKHATATVKEVALEAYNQGYEEFAYTEHVPYPNLVASRPDYDQLDQIFKEIDEEILNYQGKMKIYKALECEYVTGYHDYYKSLVDKYDLDFLILGHHFSEFVGNPDNHDVTKVDKRIFLDEANDFFAIKDVDTLHEYERTVIKAIESGLFKIIAHPDVFLNRSPFNDEAVLVAKNIFKALEASDMYVEINANGLRNGCNYPHYDFLKLSTEYNLKYVVNADSHALSHLSDEYLPKAYALANELGIEVTEFIEL